VRDCIALESRLTTATLSTSRAATLRADPRSTPLQDALRNATENHPDRAALRREITTRLDEALAADPDQTLDLPTIFFSICEDLNLEIDLATLPDEIIGLDTNPTDAPDPRATSPP
jgi:hypothetical protein